MSLIRGHFFCYNKKKEERNTSMEMIALLRGVTPTGKNRIPKMSELVTNLSNAGFNNVRTYIQSGNIIID